MPAPIKVENSDRYGRLIILKEINQCGNGRRFLCECICGGLKEVNLSKLTSGNTKSCGCLQKETRGKSTRTHGMTGSRLYNIWNGMRERCSNPKNTIFEYYGGRGIKVSEQWLRFVTFMEWALSNGYEENLTIERKDVNGDYCPENCEWISMGKQNLNRRNTLLVEYKGEKKPLKIWCKDLDLGYLRIWKRLNKGWTADEAFEIEYGKRKTS